MKKILFISFVITCLFASCDQSSNTVKQTGKDPSILDLISGMTIAEKAGQMTQINLDVISVGEIFNLEEPHQLDEKKLHIAIIDKHVGSFLNVGGHAYNLNHWQNIMRQIQKVATEEGKSKIPIIYGIDAIHGANYLMEGTLFPQPIAQAATFNPELVQRVAQITAYETRASGLPWNFSPVVDVARQPLWSRVFETYGEDVHLVKEMGSACVRGYEGDDISNPEHVAACLKHFLGYSWPISGKDRTPVYMAEIQLREYFLPSFQKAIDEGVASIMINSGELNGIPVHADKKILTDLLRVELGFEGVAVTDWEDIIKLRDYHRVAATMKDAVKMAVMAGIDMSMTPNNYSFTDLLVELVKEDEIPESRLDESVYRILKMKKDLGLFEEPLSFENKTYDKVGSDEFSEASYETACEAITLLRNQEAVLPLKVGTKVLLTGPAANSMLMLNGAWSRTWQGTDPQYDDPHKMTILDAMNNEVGLSLTYREGCTIDELTDVNLAVNAAKNSDVIVLCLGELPSTEKPGDIDNLTISNAQIELTKALAKTGKPIVCVLVENRPQIISAIEPFFDAVIMAYHPGEEGARAIRDVITGKINPSGKLPFTYPRYVNTLITYDHKYTERLDPKFGMNAFNPQWEFGDGLSYSNFEYKNLKVSEDTMRGDGSFSVEVQVQNNGPYDAKESALVFVSDRVASITPPVKRLRAFKKQLIEKDELITYTFNIPIDELRFVDRDNNWVIEEGWFDIQINNLKDSLYYTP